MNKGLERPVKFFSFGVAQFLIVAIKLGKNSEFHNLLR